MQGPHGGGPPEAIRGEVLDYVQTRFQPSAVAFYGSRVAGYAKPDSDYDVIVVIPGFKDVKYIYTSAAEGRMLSILAVDEEQLMMDAKWAKLGEFVVGRLLNPYVPLKGGRILEDVSGTYRRRVMLEELRDLYEQYERLLLYMNMPYEFFLFSKLKKRAAIYRPVLYSYVKTYGGENYRLNIGRASEGFREAARALEADHLGMATEDGFLVQESVLHTLRSSQFRKNIKFIERAIRQYVTHGLSGSVGLDIIIRETISKIRRASDMGVLPDYLENPHSLLTLKVGYLITRDDWLSALASHEGFSGRQVTKKQLGRFYSTASLYLVDQGQRKFIVKDFADTLQLKWYILGALNRSVRAFSVSPISRLSNEYVGTLKLKDMGILTPDILAVSARSKVLVRESIDGELLTSAIMKYMASGEGGETVGSVARIFARCHNANMAIGDTKPENMILKGKGIYLIDLEQFKEDAPMSDKCWDVAEFVYFSLALARDRKRAPEFLDIFSELYAESGDRGVLKGAANPKYVLPFRTVINPNSLSYYQKEVSSRFTI